MEGNNSLELLIKYCQLNCGNTLSTLNHKYHQFVLYGILEIIYTSWSILFYNVFSENTYIISCTTKLSTITILCGVANYILNPPLKSDRTFSLLNFSSRIMKFTPTVTPTQNYFLSILILCLSFTIKVHVLGAFTHQTPLQLNIR